MKDNLIGYNIMLFLINYHFCVNSYSQKTEQNQNIKKKFS